MSTEPISGQPYQGAGSLQTDYVQNMMLNHFSTWVQAVVISIGNNAPPGSPVEGGRYVVGTAPTGLWANQANKVAVYRSAVWNFATPKPGWRVHTIGGSTSEYSGVAWVTVVDPAIASAIAALVDSSPATLDTLNELAAALGDDPNFATTMTALIGTKQPGDATLTTLAALATAADKGVYFTGADAAELFDLTAFARTLLDDADATAMRATLGIVGNNIAEPVNVLASAAGVVNIDCSLGDYFTLTLTENVTGITFSSLPAAGFAQTIMVKVIQGAAAYTVAWPAAFKWAGGAVGAVSTANGVRDRLAITSDDQGTTWDATLAKAFA